MSVLNFEAAGQIDDKLEQQDDYVGVSVCLGVRGVGIIDICQEKRERTDAK